MFDSSSSLVPILESELEPRIKLNFYISESLLLDNVLNEDVT